MKNISIEQKIGQLFILGFSGEKISRKHPIARDIRENNLGGVILFDRLLAKGQKNNNIANGKQVYQLTRYLQDLADNRLFITVDQEGGRVSRFSKERGFPVSPSAQDLGLANDSKHTAKCAQQTAQMLKEAGVNYNLAPVVDLNSYTDNPIIGKYGRSFSDDVTVVASHAKIWIEEHRKASILTCLKHFPGHGSSHSDSHLGFVDITSTWDERELDPYRHLIQNDLADSVMIGHLFNKKFDDTLPATLSKATLDQLLKKELHYNGLVISDDMQMGAITAKYGLEKACCQAIAAGIDSLIIGNNLIHDPEILSKLTEAIIKDIKRNKISEGRIEEAYGKIQSIKQRLMAS